MLPCLEDPSWWEFFLESRTWQEQDQYLFCFFFYPKISFNVISSSEPLLQKQISEGQDFVIVWPMQTYISFPNNQSCYFMLKMFLVSLIKGFLHTSYEANATRAYHDFNSLNLYIQTIVFISSTMFALNFTWSGQGALFWQLWASKTSDHFLYSHDLYIWLKGDIVRRI